MSDECSPTVSPPVGTMNPSGRGAEMTKSPPRRTNGRGAWPAPQGGADMTHDSPTPSRRGRRTLYRGVMMRSRTEARFAAQLDAARIPWDYEPFALAGPTGQWLPDFELHMDPRRRCLVDVKPTLNDVLDNIERWHRIATEALPGQSVQVFGAGYDGTATWTERSLIGPAGDWEWRTVGVQIEAVHWDGDRAIYQMLSAGQPATWAAVFGAGSR